MRTSSSTSTSDPKAAYFGAAAVAMLLPVALAIGLNWWIDPFNRLGRNWIGVYSASERDAKIAMIEARSPAGVILGSSKTTYIPPAALDRPGFFNASRRRARG